MKKSALILIFIMLTSVAGITGKPAYEPTIFIKRLVPAGVDEPVAAKISGEIERAVVKCGRYEVMSQDMVAELFRDMETAQAVGCNDEACLKQIMKTTQTEYVMYGDVTLENNEIIVTLKLMRRKESGDAAIELTAREYIKALDTRALESAAAKLIASLHPKPAEKTRKEIPTGTLTITSNPSEAEVYFSRKLQGKTPLSVSAPLGELTVGLRDADNRIVYRLVDVKSGTQDLFIDVDAQKTPEHEIKTRTIGTMEFVFIPGGTYYMGPPVWESAEGRQQWVAVPDFWMGKNEVTQKQYSQVLGETGRMPDYTYFGQGDDYPVYEINWNEASTFAAKFSTKYEVNARLPYEKEWEYACRAGTYTTYYWGEELSGKYCWYNQNGDAKAHRVGGKKSNAFGLYDLIGNAEEWCMDGYLDTKASHPNDRRMKRKTKGGASVATYSTTVVSYTSASAHLSREDQGFSELGMRIVVVENKK
jgi:formylglycine-generating enzyme required for sulfatase activity